MRQQLKTRRDLLAQSLRDGAPDLDLHQIPPGHLNLWARLPESTNVHHLVREGESRGLLIAPGTEWFPAAS